MLLVGKPEAAEGWAEGGKQRRQTCDQVRHMKRRRVTAASSSEDDDRRRKPQQLN